MNPKIAHDITKQRGSYNLKNKFEYGTDKKGGISARNKPVSNDEVMKCLDFQKDDNNVNIANKEYIER